MKSEKKALKNQKHKVLLVDDEKMIRWPLGEALRGWGYEPIEAGTAGAALTASNSFDDGYRGGVLRDSIRQGPLVDSLRGGDQG